MCDNGKVKKLRTPCSSDAAFSTLVLAPLFKLLDGDDVSSEPLFAGASTTAKKKEDKALALLRRRFPLARAVQRCVVTQVPPPITALRDHVMFPHSFDEDGPALAYCAKFFENSGCVYGACRVLRGVLRVGELITVDGVEVQIDALYAMMGSDLLSIDEAPRGSIIALGPALSSAFAGNAAHSARMT